jgi:hypothetical protein
MLIWTIYKDNPFGTPNDRAEYYRYRSVRMEDENGGDRYKPEEHHGWWSDSEHRAVLDTRTLSPQDGVPHKESMALLDAALRSRVRQGFVYLFGLDPMVSGNVELTLTEDDTLDSVLKAVREMW